LVISLVASLSASQDEANAFMAKKFKQIPAQAFYTAMAQLISRVIHDDKETALVVRGILRRVLTKFPGQAMWPLAWLRQSRDPERLQIGDALFHEAERGLMKGPNQTLFKVLVASKSLFKYFQELAKYPVKDSTVHTINVKSWKGEVDLTEFVPPIQAALSITMPSQENGRSRDLFPRQVPRMRSFNPRVGVMGSKARPKKLKAFVVATDSRDRPRSSDSTLDIGEIHFLVKQEAKGDLRKDARVQDLNNVINRLMASSNESKGTSRNRRRLHLRTFAVTCLSEETGLLEWVPDTESLRSLVCSSYNPQASPFSSKRRGRRLANFGDPMLRNNFEKKCQEMYFINGNLTRAAALFEELCMKPYPPLLFWWFCQKFHDPHAWYEARTRFTLSAAAWSAVGHVIGLGDRHSDNILVDTTTGECVHVDFDW
jgi:serine/threonine-protein kinase ATR